MIFKSKMSCSQYSANLGCVSFTQKNFLVNNLCKWLAKMLDGKFCSDQPHTITLKNSKYLTKIFNKV